MMHGLTLDRVLSSAACRARSRCRSAAKLLAEYAKSLFKSEEYSTMLLKVEDCSTVVGN